MVVSNIRVHTIGSETEDRHIQALVYKFAVVFRFVYFLALVCVCYGLGGTIGSRLFGIRHTGCVRLFVFQVMIGNKVHLAGADVAPSK